MSRTHLPSISSVGTIHIVGAGTCTINVSQASDGTYPAASVDRTLIVNKKALNIKVADTSKLQGEANPQFTFVYSGFVLGENASVLDVLPSATTTATVFSIPGTYSVLPFGAQAKNYSFSYSNGSLKIYPKDSTQQQINVYTSNGNLHVSIYSPFVDLTDLILYNSNGQLLRKKNVLVSEGQTSAIIDMSYMASGTYILVYKGKRSTSSVKFLNIK